MTELSNPNASLLLNQDKSYKARLEVENCYNLLMRARMSNLIYEQEDYFRQVLDKIEKIREILYKEQS